MDTKLHELLAVEANLKGQAEVTRKDLISAFDKKKHNFVEVVETFKSTKEGVEDKVEGQLGLQTTVYKELDWISDKIAAAIDASHAIDVANTSARSDIVLEDGNTILRNIPATSLLQLEKRIKEFQEIIAAIPTLDPARGFVLDTSRGENIYRARDVEKPRTEKQFSYTVMVPPTKEHPAQVKEHMLDIPIGTLVHQEWCSFITVAEKSEMFDRTEELLRAVKKARSRANDEEIDVRENKIGLVLLNYIVKGLGS